MPTLFFLSSCLASVPFILLAFFFFFFFFFIQFWNSPFQNQDTVVLFGSWQTAGPWCGLWCLQAAYVCRLCSSFLCSWLPYTLDPTLNSYHKMKVLNSFPFLFFFCYDFWYVTISVRNTFVTIYKVKLSLNFFFFREKLSLLFTPTSSFFSFSF